MLPLVWINQTHNTYDFIAIGNGSLQQFLDQLGFVMPRQFEMPGSSRLETETVEWCVRTVMPKKSPEPPKPTAAFQLWLLQLGSLIHQFCENLETTELCEAFVLQKTGLLYNFGIEKAKIFLKTCAGFFLARLEICKANRSCVDKIGWHPFFFCT